MLLAIEPVNALGGERGEGWLPLGEQWLSCTTSMNRVRVNGPIFHSSDRSMNRVRVKRTFSRNRNGLTHGAKSYSTTQVASISGDYLIN